MTCRKCNHDTVKKFGRTRNNAQRYRCLSCKITFSEAQPKIGNHYKDPETVSKVLALMLEGMSVNSISRITGLHKNTILSLMITAAESCERIFNRLVTGIKPRFVQADEIWSFVGCHQRRLRQDAPAEWGDQYTWIAIDSETKLVISFHVGKRDAINANRFIGDLSRRVTGRFQLTTDGLKGYVPAAEEHFGANIDFAQLIKIYKTPDFIGPEWFSAGKVIEAFPSVVSGNPDESKISTSHIERKNLTVRMQLKRFCRLTLAHSKKLLNHKAAIALYMCWYNFCRTHQTLRVTPAMEAGITDHVWSLGELLQAA
jgi:IS1 family transposase/transposase-like protein